MDSHSFEPLPLLEWFDLVNDKLQRFCSQEVVVVAVVGKDTMEKRKGEDLNDLLGEEFFPPYVDGSGGLSIEALFSPEFRAVFLIVNGCTDASFLASTFTGTPDKSFFDALYDGEQLHHHLLLFVCTVSHIVLFIEQGCRFDVSLARTLKSVNKMRLSSRDELRNCLSEGGVDLKTWLKEGRVAVPRFLFAFHRNTVRQDLGHAKKREIYDKLEQGLEQQIYNVFKLMKIVDNGHSSSLGYMPDKAAYVRLMTSAPSNPIGDMLSVFMGEEEEIEERGDRKGRPKLSALSEMVKESIETVRTEKIYAYEKPTLAQFVATASVAAVLLDEEDSLVEEKVLARQISKELNFMDSLTEKHLADAISLYSGVKEKERNVFTKVEHDNRFASAVSYLESVCVGNSRNELMVRLRSACDGMWQRGCEQTSLTGHFCQLTMHPSIGDRTVDRSTWQLHSSGAKYVSSCSCGRTQALRTDPFTLKEANFDFYENNSTFTCCDRLEKHDFPTIDQSKEGAESADEGGIGGVGGVDDGLWTVAQPEPRQFISRNRLQVKREDSAEASEEEDSADSQTSDVDERVLGENPLAASSSAEDVRSSASSSEDVLHRNYLDDDREVDVSVREPTDKMRNSLIEFEDKRSALKQKKIPFLDTLPHSLSPFHLPIFSSWGLTCVGASSLYSHTYGLRDMPGFRPGCDYLLPWDVMLEVDREMWNRDMQYVQEFDATADYWKNRYRRRVMRNTEKVKLFIGFEYECPRGHRMFIGPDLEPLGVAKGSAKDYISRDAASQLSSQDIPLWRPCTCRKPPLVNAQLMRVHVVTPKAPVTVTLLPKVQAFPTDEGYFYPGEDALDLAWSRYYILRLPFSYAGPNGTVLPPNEVGSHGRFKADCLSVTYSPLTSWID